MKKLITLLLTALLCLSLCACGAEGSSAAGGDVLFAGVYHTVGLKADGTVVAVGRKDDGRCEVGGWTDIVAVSADWYHTVGLKADGTVVAVGNNDHGQCNVEDWVLKVPD